MRVTSLSRLRRFILQLHNSYLLCTATAEQRPNQNKTNYTYAFPASTLALVSGVVNTQQTAKSNGFVMGEMLSEQEGSKSPTSYAYCEPSGLVQTITAPLPGTVGSASTAQTSFTYDNLGNVLTSTSPGNNAASSLTTTFGYGSAPALGQPLTVTDNLGEVTHLRYDAQGNATAVIDALGNETDMTYTIANEMLATSLPATGQTGSGHAGSQVAYSYTQPAANANAQWPAAALQYGPARMTTQYDESSNAIRQVVSRYDYEGHLLGVTGSTEPVSYSYDALYRLSMLTDGGNHSTSYFYNAAGYLQQVVYPGAQATPPLTPLSAGTPDTVTFGSPDNATAPGYDPDGNLLSRVDGRGQATTYTYADPESLLTQITYPSGTISNVTLGYDAYGRRHTMTDGTGSQTYAYDDNDDLTSKNVTWMGLSGKTISYAYNPDGSRQTMTADGRAFAYAYDGVGRMSSLTNDNSEATHYTYLANGWLQTKTLANGVVTTFTRDVQGRLRDLANKNGSGATLSDFAVPATGGYDGVGNRLSVTASLPGVPASYSGTTSYQYDYGQSASPQMNRSQLTGETSTRNSGYTNAFGYDGGTSGGPGNPTSFKGTTNTFNSDNQVTGMGFGYDGNGSPNTYKSAALTFDPEQRMTADGAGSQTDGYSGDGLRAWKQSGSTKSYFLYDGTQPVSEYGSSGTLLATNTYGADGLVSRHTSATAFYLFDERGNVAQRTSSTGAVLGSELYDAYGTRTGTAAQADPFGFEGQAGYYTDTETGLLLCTHRFYDPSNGRWLTRDPMGYAGGVNLYGYVGNDPGNEDDPDGTLAGPVIGAAGTAVGLGGGPEDPIGDGIAATIVLAGLGNDLGNGIAGLIPGQDGLPADPQNSTRSKLNKQPQMPTCDDNITPADCHKAIKLLTQWARLAQKFGKNIGNSTTNRLNQKMGDGSITSGDLPGSIGNEFPDSLKGYTLNEIREKCKGK